MVTSDQIVGRPRTECAVTSILTESATTPVNWYTSVIVQIKHLDYRLHPNTSHIHPYMYG